MRYFALLACILLVASTRQALCASEGNLEPMLYPRGSPSRSPSPPPSSPKGKGSAHETHSTRLFGVNIHPHHATPPAHEAATTHSTRLFGVNVTPGKATQSASRSYAHSNAKASKPGNVGHLIKGLYVHPSKVNRPGFSTRPATDDSQKSKTEKKPWWKQAGGRPLVRRPHGTGPRFEEQREAREKKKQRKVLQGQHTDQHPSGHPKGGGRRPGSPGAGAHAVSKRKLAGTEY